MLATDEDLASIVKSKLVKQPAIKHRTLKNLKKAVITKNRNKHISTLRVKKKQKIDECSQATKNELLAAANMCRKTERAISGWKLQHCNTIAGTLFP